MVRPPSHKPHKANMIIPTECPFCKSDLKGDAIKDCEWAYTDDKKSFWSRVKVVVGQDKPTAWMCPDCGKEWAIGWLNNVPHPLKKSPMGD